MLAFFVFGAMLALLLLWGYCGGEGGVKGGGGGGGGIWGERGGRVASCEMSVQMRDLGWVGGGLLLLLLLYFIDEDGERERQRVDTMHWEEIDDKKLWHELI